MTAVEAQKQPGESAEEYRVAIRGRVLREVQRIAAERGETPGCDTFGKLTGLSQALWHGGIWARWSDAVREAGLVPNDKRSRLGDEELLAGFAEAARKHGKIPTNAELLLHRRSGACMAVQSTFRRHFGSKRKLLQRLKLWAGQNPERADIAAMLLGIDAEEPAAPRANGAVYLLRSGPSYKIGCSRVQGHRTRSIVSGLPVSAKVVHVIETDDPYGVEAYWHRRFAEKRTRGEWFRLSAEDVAVFRERRFQ